jgi:hypothetical protein
MNDQQLTPWFPHFVKPVRVGYYQVCWEGRPRELAFGGLPAWWDGKRWCHNHDNNFPMFAQKRKWRGLAHEPK